jgi:hypothetical protein
MLRGNVAKSRALPAFKDTGARESRLRRAWESFPFCIIVIEPKEAEPWSTARSAEIR